MKSYFYLLMAVLIMTAGVTGCKSSKNSVQIAQKEEVRTASSFDEANLVVQKPRVMALPSVIIYKTKADYTKNVPVGLNEEKTSIVSYPGQTDLKDQEPIPLKHGFLLDKRGVNLNSAFLKYTYAEFLALDAIPPIAELFNAIIDADPFTEMYDCGKVSDFHDGDLEEQLNQALMESNGNPETIYKRLK
jgi:hypothetical protein